MPTPPPHHHIDTDSVDYYELWFRHNYLTFAGIRYGYPCFEFARLQLQKMDADVGRLLMKKEEELGIWHCNDVWRNYLGFILHGRVANLYTAFHKMLATRHYETEVITTMLIVGVRIIVEQKLREDVCMKPTTWTTKTFECI